MCDLPELAWQTKLSLTECGEKEIFKWANTRKPTN